MGCCSSKDGVVVREEEGGSAERSFHGDERSLSSRIRQPDERDRPSPTFSDPELLPPLAGDNSGELLPPILAALAEATHRSAIGSGGASTALPPPGSAESHQIALAANPDIATMLQVAELEAMRRILAATPGNEDAVRDITQHLQSLSMLSLLALVAHRAAKAPTNNTDKTINPDSFEFVANMDVGRAPTAGGAPLAMAGVDTGLGPSGGSGGSNLDAQSSYGGPDCTVCSFPISEAVSGELGTIPDKLQGSFGAENSVPIRCRSCHNTFHAVCLAKWMEEHDACPLCRASFVKDSGRPKVAAAELGGHISEVDTSSDDDDDDSVFSFSNDIVRSPSINRRVRASR